MTRARLLGVSVGASLWFSLWFFALFPAAVLVLSGSDLVPAPGAALWVGGVVTALALAGIAFLVGAFIRVGHGTHAPFAPPERLVTSTWYARSRNPMYLLYGVVAIGEAVAWCSFPLAIYAVAFLALIHLYLKRFEEPALARRFGDAWHAYARRVPRYLFWGRSGDGA